MFLNDTDYRVVIGEAAFKAVSQASHEVIQRAEQEAVEEVAGYLRPKYDVNAIFGAQEQQRNPQIVMVTADIALYHMVASLPARLAYEIRETRYKRAIQWLEGVAAGKIVPELPLHNTGTGQDARSTKINWSSAWKRNNQW